MNVTIDDMWKVNELPGWSAERLRDVAAANGVRLVLALRWVLTDPKNQRLLEIKGLTERADPGV